MPSTAFAHPAAAHATRSLVFGANGFIGSHVVARLRAQQQPLVAVVRAGADTGYLRSLGVQPTVVDFSDNAALCSVLQGSGVVYNCLAHPRRHQRLAALRTVEVDLTRKLMQLAAQSGVARWVQLSTVQVYGFSRPPVSIDESFLPAPTYAFNQVALEREEVVQTIGAHTGLAYTLLRPANVLGARDKNIRPLLAAHRARLFMTVGSTRAQPVRFSAISAADAARALLLVGTHPQAANRTFLAKGFDTDWLALQRALDAQTGHGSLRLNLPRAFAHAVGAACEALPYAFEPALTRFSAAVMGTHTLFDDSAIRALGFAPQDDLPAAVAALLS